MKLTPFEATILSDPSLEAGDIITIYDLHGNAYKTLITNVIFKLDGKMTISCDAETINEKQRSTYSQSAKVIAAAKKETEKQLSAYNVRAKQFSELTANAMGYYQTEVTQDDGSVICYQHDKPLLSDSRTIWKKSTDTISVSNDGGKNWMGLDKDGNAVLKVLATEGIIADWIKAGTISNQTGSMSISLNLGKIEFSVDNSGKMVLHTSGFTLYDEGDKVLASVFCSTNNRGVVTANVMMVGERDNETTYISEDNSGKGYISTNSIIIDELKTNKEYIKSDHVLATQYGFRLLNSSDMEIGSFFSSSNEKAVLCADKLTTNSDYIKSDAVIATPYGFRLLNSSGIEIGSLFSSLEGKAVLMLNGKQYSEKTITLDGQTITYLGV